MSDQIECLDKKTKYRNEPLTWKISGNLPPIPYQPMVSTYIMLDEHTRFRIGRNTRVSSSLDYLNISMVSAHTPANAMGYAPISA